MHDNYLDIPLNFNAFIQKGEVRRINEINSIHNMIHLIVTTEYGELRHDPAFGCDLRKFDFESIYNLPKFREELRKSLLNSIQRNEPRISDIKMDIQIEQAELPYRINNRKIKIRITLSLTGTVERTNEVFTHQEKFFIGPLSYS